MCDASRVPVVVLYFAAIRELIGTGEERLNLAPTCRTVDQAAEHLCTLHPQLRAHLAGVRFAVNETFVSGGEAVSEGDTLALIPPVSGG